MTIRQHCRMISALRGLRHDELRELGQAVEEALAGARRDQEMSFMRHAIEALVAERTKGTENDETDAG